tara:strand:- start:611 stop:1312 length:702 start_codon:yes stop_codon:yes gene_type:complete
MRKEICLFCDNEIEIVVKNDKKIYFTDPYYIECEKCGILWDYERILAIDELLRDVYNKPTLRNIPSEKAYRQKYLSFYKDIKSFHLPLELPNIKELKQKKVRTRLSRIRKRLAKNNYKDELGFIGNLGVFIVAIFIASFGVWIHINVSYGFNIIIFIFKWFMAFPFWLAVTFSIPSLFINLFTPNLSAKQQKRRDLKQKRIQLEKTDELINKYSKGLLGKYPSLRALVGESNE